MKFSTRSLQLTLLCCCFILTAGSGLRAAFIQPDSLTTNGGSFNGGFTVENLTNESVTAPTDTISATEPASGLAYATANPPASGLPVTVILELNTATDISAFYLWNNATSATISSKGIKDFTLKFYDAPGGAAGGGSQIGSDYSNTATQGPTTGTYAAEQFVFGSTYSGVRSVELIVTNNFIGESWLGAREIGFEGTSNSSFVVPNSITTTGGEFSTSFLVGNLTNEGVTSPLDTLDATTAQLNTIYATSNPPSILPFVVTFEFTTATDLNAFFLWNNATNATVADRGIKDFTLTFYDASGGSGGGGNQVGSTYSGSAAKGPTTGSYAAQQFVFASTYANVKSVEMTISNSHLGSGWMGAREIGFDGTASTTIPPEDLAVTKVLVYLVGGQSNADGYGIPAELSSADQLPTPSVRFYHANAGGQSPLTADQWIDLQPGSGSKSGNAGRFGPELQFGRDMDTALGAVRCKVAILKHTLGATNLYSDWAAGGDATTSGDGPVYQAFQTTVAAGLASLGALYPNASIQIEGMIWHQGEGDVNGGQHNNYQTNLTNFIADLRLTYGAQMKFVIVQLSNSQWSASATTTQARVDVVQAAQQSVADASPLNGMTMTSDLDVLPGNIIHFGTTANLATGARAAEMMMKLPITDADGNGLDDTWETTHFGSTGQIASADPDHDGWSNGEEYQWLSSPLLGSSRPAVMIDSAAGVLEWQPRVGLRYYVEQSRDLTHWTRVESYIPALDASSQQWALPEPGDSEPTFYRLGAQK